MAPDLANHEVANRDETHREHQVVLEGGKPGANSIDELVRLS